MDWAMVVGGLVQVGDKAWRWEEFKSVKIVWLVSVLDMENFFDTFMFFLGARTNRLRSVTQLAYLNNIFSFQHFQQHMLYAQHSVEIIVMQFYWWTKIMHSTESAETLWYTRSNYCNNCNICNKQIHSVKKLASSYQEVRKLHQLKVLHKVVQLLWPFIHKDVFCYQIWLLVLMKYWISPLFFFLPIFSILLPPKWEMKNFKIFSSDDMPDMSLQNWKKSEVWNRVKQGIKSLAKRVRKQLGAWGAL